MLAHKYPNITLGELFDLLCDLGIKQFDPGKVGANKKMCVTKAKTGQNEIFESEVQIIKPETRVIKSKAQIRREVFQKANNQCEICGSSYALEIDHIKPKSLGGDDSAKNLRLLCRSCNQRAAIKTFGVNKMQRYLN